MSDIKNHISQTMSELESLKKKRYEIDKHRIEGDYKDLIERKDEVDQNNSIDLSGMSVKRLKQIKEDNERYLNSVTNAKCFINNDFKGKVPFFGRNIVFVAAKTGHGKTTISKNIAFHTIMQGGKVLYIGNEENAADIYNGITAIYHKWSYTNHDQITKEQRNTYFNFVDKWATRMVVIDDHYQSKGGQTTTLEGVKAIFNSLKKTKTQYTAIIFDYFQNVVKSNERPWLKNWQVQEELAKFLDTFKNDYLAPIVILSQLKEGKDLAFKEAIEGRKSILNVSTCAMQVTAEREYKRTAFKIHKSRFTSAIGETIYVGFDKGKYVDYTPEFKNQVELEITRKEQQNLLSSILNKDCDD